MNRNGRALSRSLDANWSVSSRSASCTDTVAASWEMVRCAEWTAAHPWELGRAAKRSIRFVSRSQGGSFRASSGFWRREGYDNFDDRILKSGL
jgi:hypothetical protein